MKKLGLIFIISVTCISCKKNSDDQNINTTYKSNTNIDQNGQTVSLFDSSTLNFIARNLLSGKLEPVKLNSATAYIDENYSEPVGNLFIEVSEFPNDIKSPKGNRGLMFFTLRHELDAVQKLIQFPEQYTNPPTAMDSVDGQLQNVATGEIVVHSLNSTFADVEFRNVKTADTVLNGRAQIPFRR